ncbi:MAG TPA: hypothetical protein RMH26_15570, partial [Polyangiaceae bacterium LLY-WYZ-15_(1-7)]|nr:hypothetical protein [Polyangiaceae bacterium LLY-WYZ-15_(1-7)]
LDPGPGLGGSEDLSACGVERCEPGEFCCPTTGECVDPDGNTNCTVVDQVPAWTVFTEEELGQAGPWPRPERR